MDPRVRAEHLEKMEKIFAGFRAKHTDEYIDNLEKLCQHSLKSVKYNCHPHAPTSMSALFVLARMLVRLIVNIDNVFRHIG